MVDPSLYGILSSAMTVVSFATFLGIVAWAYGRGRRAAFEEAANAPFALPDDVEEGGSGMGINGSGGERRS